MLFCSVLQEQSQRFLHTAFSVSPEEGYVQLAERLNQLAPGNFKRKHRWYCYERGVQILSAGTYGNVIRLQMPLVISDEQFAEARRFSRRLSASLQISSSCLMGTIICEWFVWPA